MRLLRGLAATLLWAILCSPASATNVLFETSLGDFEVELYDEETPLTVANFLNYVVRGDYQGSFIHRAIPRFIVQGGGYVFEDGVAFLIPTDPAVPNEPGISNTRGTIAMAKQPNNPNSATSQWFFNIGNNGSNLDNQNGGFTVFGRVLGDGLDILDNIARRQFEGFAPPFDDIPLIGYSGSGDIQANNLVIVSITVIEEFPINAGLNDAWYNPATLGQGFFITVFPNSGKVFLAWFTFDTERPPGSVEAIMGDPGARWLTAFGDYENGRAELAIEVTRGGVFDSAAPMTTQDLDGTIILEFADCENGLVSYDIPSLGLQGEIPIQRIALDNVERCEQLVATQ